MSAKMCLTEPAWRGGGVLSPRWIVWTILFLAIAVVLVTVLISHIYSYREVIMCCKVKNHHYKSQSTVMLLSLTCEKHSHWTEHQENKYWVLRGGPPKKFGSSFLGLWVILNKYKSSLIKSGCSWIFLVTKAYFV